MDTPLSVLQVLGLVLAGLVAGAALLVLFVSWVASHTGDNAGPGCTGVGLVLLAVAAFIAVQALIVS
jgi:uncharacterized membrane-anchored protein